MGLGLGEGELRSHREPGMSNQSSSFWYFSSIASRIPIRERRGENEEWYIPVTCITPGSVHGNVVLGMGIYLTLREGEGGCGGSEEKKTNSR